MATYTYNFQYVQGVSDVSIIQSAIIGASLNIPQTLTAISYDDSAYTQQVSVSFDAQLSYIQQTTLSIIVYMNNPLITFAQTFIVPSGYDASILQANIVASGSVVQPLLSISLDTSSNTLMCVFGYNLSLGESLALINLMNNNAPLSTFVSYTYENPIELFSLTTLSSNIINNSLIKTPLLGVDYDGFNVVTCIFASALSTMEQLLVNNMSVNNFSNDVSLFQQESLGYNSGYSSSSKSICIGNLAGEYYQSVAIAVGTQAGQNNQGSAAVALGTQCGVVQQGNFAVGIGCQAGQIYQGDNAIAIGYLAGVNNQYTNSIILNATGALLDASANSGFFVAPLTQQTDPTTANLLTYNTTTNEISYNSAKTFVIPHPLAPDSKYLVHACLEGPEAGVYYRGRGQITNDCGATIALPTYATAFTNFNIQITPIGAIGQVYSVSDVNALGEFHVFGKNGDFFWVAFGERGQIEVEPEKSSATLAGDGPYTYLV